jgi:hypothetical protein
VLKKLAINGYIEVSNYGEKKNEDFVIKSFEDNETFRPLWPRPWY